ncbi:MAG: hypothetical protein Q8L68_02835 [Methylococcales bacterium]|nr:hypothetical protein [Methylococcales bacterium]
MKPVKDSKPRLVIAWVSLWLMLTGGGVLTLYIFSFSLLFYLGGMELAAQAFNGVEDKTQHYTSFLYPLIFVSVPLGGKIGIWLWGKLARKIKLVSDEKISKMGG